MQIKMIAMKCDYGEGGAIKACGYNYKRKCNQSL